MLNTEVRVVNQPLFPPSHPTRDTGRPLPRDPNGDVPPARRSWWILALVTVAAFVLTGCDSEPVEEVGVGDVTGNGQASVQPEDGSVSLSGEVAEILTESALTITDEGSEGPLLVLLTPATIVNGTAVTLGGQPGGLAQVLPSEATLQFVGTIETFDSGVLAERLGIVLNDELFAPWEGDPVLIAEMVETFTLDAAPAADTNLGSE